MAQTKTLAKKATTYENIQRKLVRGIFNELTEGRLVVYENGKVFGDFGNKNSDLKADIYIQNNKFFARFVFGGSIGAAESFMDEDWSTNNLRDLVRVFLRNESALDKLDKKFAFVSYLFNKFSHLKNRNSLKKAKSNISYHYDLGNSLYENFLDQRMLYSSAVFENETVSLESAQEEKLQRICEKLKLRPTDHVVEIGTGWGGLAIYMAKNYGCQVTTTTISEEQYKYAQELVKKNQLEDKITLLKKDYRLLEGKFDKLVSIEMIEAVGHEYLDEFFKKCEDLLKSDGIMLLQVITLVDQRMNIYKNNVDFIQKYIFPGGFLPSINLISNKITKHTDFIIRDLEDLGASYALTLREWYKRFNENYSNLNNDYYDRRFKLLWQFYLQSCEAGFLERTSSAAQILFSRRNYLD